TFYRLGLIRRISDIYSLNERQDELIGIERFGKKSIENMLAGIDKSKQKPFEKVLFALGIRHVGETVAKKLALHFQHIEAIKAATIDELLAVPDVGSRIADSIHAYLNDLNHWHEIERLKAAGLQL